MTKQDKQRRVQVPPSPYAAPPVGGARDRAAAGRAVVGRNGPTTAVLPSGEVTEAAHAGPGAVLLFEPVVA